MRYLFNISPHDFIDIYSFIVIVILLFFMYTYITKIYKRNANLQILQQHVDPNDAKLYLFKNKTHFVSVNNHNLNENGFESTHVSLGGKRHYL